MTIDTVDVVLPVVLLLLDELPSVVPSAAVLLDEQKNWVMLQVLRLAGIPSTDGGSLLTWQLTHS